MVSSAFAFLATPEAGVPIFPAMRGCYLAPSNISKIKCRRCCFPICTRYPYQMAASLI